MNDEAIINLIYEKNEYGLQKLAKKYEKLLIYIAAGILGNRSRDIEECVNDSYLKLWNHIESYDMNRASLKTYLKIIVRNTAINKLRDLSKREDKEIPEDISDIAKYYVDSSQSVERKVFGKEDIRQLNEVIQKLGTKDRELVIRKYFYLQSSKEISKAMSMTVTAIDSRLSRIRNKMKQVIINEKEEYDFTRKGAMYE